MATETVRTFAELVDVIQQRYPSLAPSHQVLAERVLAQPGEVAFMTVSALAEAAGVNEATVVRFATGLGLKGYPGLTRLCRERLQEQAQMVSRYDQLQRSGDDSAELRDRAAALDGVNITRTFAGIEAHSWDEAVRLLAHSPAVHVMGLRKCHAPAYLLTYLLQLLREDVNPVTATLGLLTDQLRGIRDGDCFVAMAIHRYSADTVRATAWARERGAHIIAITDTAASPLARSAANVFYVDASSPSILRSMTAFTSLVQALAAGVAHEREHNARDSLLQEEQLLEQFDVYATGSQQTQTRKSR